MSKYFDKKAQELDQHPIMREIALKFFNTLSTHIPLSPEYRMLDYGCGSGLIGMYLYPFVNSITMMDSSTVMLDILEEKIKENNIQNMEVINSDLKSSPISDGSFDVIYLNNVLHHIEDVESFLKLVNQNLKPKGSLCIGDFEKEDGSFHEDNADVKHFGFDEAEINKYFHNSSLQILKNERYYTIKKPDKLGEMKEYPLFLATTIKV